MPTTTKRANNRRSASRDAAAKLKITNLNNATKWLNLQVDFERLRLVRYNDKTFSLDRMKALLKALGNPQKSLKIVHIAGTKGKGSTCAMLEAMLTECEYTVGLFTSPHLIEVRERIQINGEMIPVPDFVEMIKLMQATVKKMNDEPTYFELLTAMAVKYFSDQAVDIVLMETGLGGRLDSTNVLNPLVSAITEISLDHADILGDTLEKIAAEKAGIFKKNIPALTVEQSPEVTAVLREKAEEAGTNLEVLNEDIEFSHRFESNRELGPHYRVCVTKAPFPPYEHLAVPLKGEHQAKNCGLALSIMLKLQELGYEAPENKLIDGLAKTTIDGRMEIVWNEPRILIDGAHNARSIQALVKSIGAHVPYDSLVMVFGCAANKDIRGMLKEVNLGADKVIFTKCKGDPRAADPSELLSMFDEISSKMAQSCDTLGEALDLASRAVSREDIICVCGSFRLAGEAKTFLQDLANKRIKNATK